MPVAWVALVLLWWIISAVSKNAQKKKSGQPAGSSAEPGQNQTPGPVKAPSPAPAQKRLRQEEKEDGWGNRPIPAAPTVPAVTVPASPAPAATAHETHPMETHMHTPEMDREGEGTEGIDCCHDYMLTGRDEAETPDFLPLTQEEGADERARALLQGVIYSEILGRRVRRYGGKRA